jgi:hypothetical protein
MTFSGMLRCVVLARIDVSKEYNASIIRITRMGELRKMLAVTDNRTMLRASVATYC